MAILAGFDAEVKVRIVPTIEDHPAIDDIGRPDMGDNHRSVSISNVKEHDSPYSWLLHGSSSPGFSGACPIISASIWAPPTSLARSMDSSMTSLASPSNFPGSPTASVGKGSNSASTTLPSALDSSTGASVFATGGSGGATGEDSSTG